MHETYIRGFSKSHGFIVETTKVDDTLLNFNFNNSNNTIRDLLIENIGDNDVYICFSSNTVAGITIPYGETKKTTFSSDSIGWKLSPERPLAMSYCDYTNIGLICSSGQSSIVQIMGVLDTNNSNIR